MQNKIIGNPPGITGDDGGEALPDWVEEFDVRELELLEGAATPGPWDGEDLPLGYDTEGVMNREYVAALRDAAPALLRAYKEHLCGKEQLHRLHMENSALDALYSAVTDYIFSEEGTARSRMDMLYQAWERTEVSLQRARSRRPICPHCGARLSELAPEAPIDGVAVQVTCDQCNKLVSVTRHVRYSAR